MRSPDRGCRQELDMDFQARGRSQIAQMREGFSRLIQ
jgi:hypothetical protein